MRKIIFLLSIFFSLVSVSYAKIDYPLLTVVDLDVFTHHPADYVFREFGYGYVNTGKMEWDEDRDYYHDDEIKGHRGLEIEMMPDAKMTISIGGSTYGSGKNKYANGRIKIFCLYEVTSDKKGIVSIKNISPDDSLVVCTPEKGPVVVTKNFVITVRDKLYASRN